MKSPTVPKPEAGEEIATPAPTGALPFWYEPPDDALGLKSDAPTPPGTQRRVDALADAAVRHGAPAFQKTFAPVLKLLERAATLEDLRDLLEDEAEAARLYAQMDISDVEDLLQKVMLYADLEGRVTPDG